MVHQLLFYLEGDPAAGENEAVLLRQQDAFLSVPSASSRGLVYERPDGISHITKRRGGIYERRESFSASINVKCSIP